MSFEKSENSPKGWLARYEGAKARRAQQEADAARNSMRHQTILRSELEREFAAKKIERAEYESRLAEIERSWKAAHEAIIAMEGEPQPEPQKKAEVVEESDPIVEQAIKEAAAEADKPAEIVVDDPPPSDDAALNLLMKGAENKPVADQAPQPAKRPTLTIKPKNR